MKIAIDATAVPPKPMGAGWYVLRLIVHLARLDTSYKFIVFAQRCVQPFLAELPPDRVEIVWLPDKHPARRLAWEQTLFPRLIRQSGANLLHSPHYTVPLRLPIPTVVTFHDMTFFTHPHLHTLPKRLFFPWMMRRSAKKTNYLIADSENTRRDAIRLLSIPPEKIETVHLGYEDIFRPLDNPELLAATRQKYRLPEKFLLYTGAIEPRKNVSLLLTVFEQLAQRGLEQDLVLAGNLGWMYESVLSQIEGMAARKRVHRLGHVAYTELPPIYNLADVFVYPSIYEGFGLPPLEAMACGVPVITSNISSMPEFVGNAGILVPPDDETALMQAIERVLQDASLRRRLAVEGPRQASHFTWQHTAQKTLRIYEKVLAAQ